ncbi:hypothetical protein GOP47_0007210 [Adiantum capillus-veneris]|uniref:Uncharacterized protein n=1 Tax=Adiantum capillus-veneris TaxID=13818 RepID=A0A9D4V088_ADICA|nr:hypothetical protein GOP47_0007210 [Adiantum capillus-veneris]
MDWLLSCFKCGHKRRARCSVARLESKKEGREISVASGLLSTKPVEKVANFLHDGNDNHEAKRFELGKVLPMPGSGLARTSSGYIKSEQRRRSTSRHSSDQLLLVEKLEEEINNLNKKLVEEARDLRQCSKLLDSTDAFNKALDALENTSEKGCVEESQPLLYLQSMLSKIGTTELMMDNSSAHRIDERMSEGLEEESFTLSTSIDEEHKPVEESSDRTILAPDLAKRNLDSVSVEEGSKLKLEHPANIAMCQPSIEIVNLDANKPQRIPVTKRRSSTTFSFSGFIVIENETEDTTFSEHCSSSEVSVTKIIETPDTSSENLVEASKSLFAIATSSLQSHSVSVQQSLSQMGCEDFCSLREDSEVESSIRTIDAHGSLYKANESPANTKGAYGLCSGSELDESQIEISNESYEGFSDVSGRTDFSSLCSREENTLHGSEFLPLHLLSLEDKQSAKKCNKSHTSASQIENVNDVVSRSLNFADFGSSADVQVQGISKSKGHAADFSVMREDSSNNSIDANHDFKPLYMYDEVRIKSLQKMTTFLDLEKPSDSHAAASDEAKLLETDKYVDRVTPYMGSQGELSTLACNTTVKFSLGKTFSINSPSSDTLPHPFHTDPPSQQVDQRGNKSSVETLSTPISVNSCASMVSLSKDDPNKPDDTPLRTPLSKDDSNKPDYTPLRTPFASLSLSETPNSQNSQGSPTIVGEDRPILGTVAAHWNHSSSSAKKWWDGKGIPNSTNKYKEDQKVSWHATPFEVRLERALAKQGRVFQKKLFIGASEMEYRKSGNHNDPRFPCICRFI